MREYVDFLFFLSLFLPCSLEREFNSLHAIRSGNKERDEDKKKYRYMRRRELTYRSRLHVSIRRYEKVRGYVVKKKRENERANANII